MTKIQCGNGVAAYSTDGTWNRIRVGDAVNVRGEACRVVRVRPMGTIDVVSLDGEHAYRVSGLPMTSNN